MGMLVRNGKVLLRDFNGQPAWAGGSELLLDILVERVKALKPGQWISFSKYAIRDAFVLPGWTVADMVMERIPGSAYTIVLESDPLTETARFIRLAEPRRDGSRTWMSPDRR